MTKTKGKIIASGEAPGVTKTIKFFLIQEEGKGFVMEADGNEIFFCEDLVFMEDFFVSTVIEYGGEVHAKPNA